MSRAGTREILGSGNVLSILNCLMQLRKVCAHPDLFEPRPITSSFALEPLAIRAPALAVLDAPHPDSVATIPSAIVVPIADLGEAAGAESSSSASELAEGALLTADPQVQRLLARVQALGSGLGNDLLARLQQWTRPPAADGAAAAADARPIIRQRLPLVIGAPSWALITAAKVPPRPCDRVQLDVHNPKK